jgi:hypothetical protein
MSVDDVREAGESFLDRFHSVVEERIEPPLETAAELWDGVFGDTSVETSDKHVKFVMRKGSSPDALWFRADVDRRKVVASFAGNDLESYSLEEITPGTVWEQITRAQIYLIGH